MAADFDFVFCFCFGLAMSDTRWPVQSLASLSSEDEDDLKPQRFLYGEDDERYENNGAAVAELVRVKSMASLEELQLQCASKKRRLDEVERRANASSNATEAATSSSSLSSYSAFLAQEDSEEVQTARLTLRESFEQLLMHGPVLATRQDVDQQLWNRCFYTRIGSYRNCIRNLGHKNIKLLAEKKRLEENAGETDTSGHNHTNKSTKRKRKSHELLLPLSSASSSALAAVEADLKQAREALRKVWLPAISTVLSTNTFSPRLLK